MVRASLPLWPIAGWDLTRFPIVLNLLRRAETLTPNVFHHHKREVLLLTIDKWKSRRNWSHTCRNGDTNRQPQLSYWATSANQPLFILMYDNRIPKKKVQDDRRENVLTVSSPNYYWWRLVFVGLINFVPFLICNCNYYRKCL